MQVINYTGKEIGLVTKLGNPIGILHPEGCPTIQSDISLTLESDNLIPIYKNEYYSVRGLPSPDPNREIYYVVNEDVIRAIGRTRSDLLIPTEPFPFDGTTYYKNLLLPS